MITNFDEYTGKLTVEELDAARIIGDCMRDHHTGADKSVTGDSIAKGMAKYLRMNGARVRKIINYLRTQRGMLIMSSSKGYYMAENKEQVLACIASERERAKAIAYVADCLERNMNNLYASY